MTAASLADLYRQRALDKCGGEVCDQAQGCSCLAWANQRADFLDEQAEDLTVAPGAADLTFGSLLDSMIGRMFEKANLPATVPYARMRDSLRCSSCSGDDANRPRGARPSPEHVVHESDCLLAKHLPRLRAMANKGAT
jgi:hypothetical protein